MDGLEGEDLCDGYFWLLEREEFLPWPQFVDLLSCNFDLILKFFKKGKEDVLNGYSSLLTVNYVFDLHWNDFFGRPIGPVSAR